MSDSVNNTNNTSEEAKKEKDVFEIVVDQDSKMTFPTLASSKLETTDHLCELANTLFKPIFADWKGSVVNFNPNTGRLYMSLFFDQTIPVADGEIRGFEPLGGAKEESNSGLRRIQSFEQRQTEGNKFTISENAKSGLAKFIAKDNRQTEVNWKALGLITQDGDANVTRNVVNFIDPRAILREIYGTKINVFVGHDENGAPVFEEHEVDYQIIVLRASASAAMDNKRPEEGPFDIDIRQIDKAQLVDSQQKMGVRSTGRRIIVNTI